MTQTAEALQADFFKTGLVVPDIERAMADLARAFGIAWTPVRTAPLLLRYADGAEESVDLSFAYSTRGATLLELLQARPDGYYRLQPGRELHHVGMWVDELAPASRELVARGMPLEVAGVVDGAWPALFAFHTNSCGLRVELVDAAMRPAFLGWLEGGELPL